MVPRNSSIGKSPQNGLKDKCTLNPFGPNCCPISGIFHSNSKYFCSKNGTEVSPQRVNPTSNPVRDLGLSIEPYFRHKR